MSLSRRQLEQLHARLIAGRAGPVEIDQPENFIDFASNRQFLGKHLFPVQATILKVVALETELFTDLDREVIDGWQSGFDVVDTDGTSAWSGTEGTPGDLCERMEWCRDRGHRWFREVLLLIGRRGSKGYLGAIAGAWVLWTFLTEGDPHQTHGIDPTKRVTSLVFAGKKDQAVKNQFRDLKTAIMNSPAFEAFHPHATTDRIVLFTARQVARGDHLLGPDAALIEIRAAETTELGARGPAVPMLFFDEFAHLRGAGPTADSVDLYDAAIPATEQFGARACVLQTTSPWDREGQAWRTYNRACGLDPATGRPADPDHLVLQLASWRPYEHHEHADQIPMWPGGPCFEKADPVVEYNERMRREEAANPDTFAVEFRAQWRQSRSWYFSEALRSRLFGPYKGQELSMTARGTLKTEYFAHGDPSLSNANFGFAICHLEHDKDDVPHLVYDVIHHWSPSDFPDGVIYYPQIEDEIFEYIKAFNPVAVTFDPWNSAGSIQRLRARVADAGLPRQPDIYTIYPNATLNWEAYELFKTAIGHGIVHAPRYALAEAEFGAVELVNGKVLPAEAGDTRTKDVLDAMVFAAHNAIGDGAQALFDRLVKLSPRGVPASPPPGALTGDDAAFAALAATARRQNMHAAQRGYQGNNPARGQSASRRRRRRRGR